MHPANHGNLVQNPKSDATDANDAIDANCEQPATNNDSLAYPALANRTIGLKNYKTGELSQYTKYNDKGQVCGIRDVTKR